MENNSNRKKNYITFNEKMGLTELEATHDMNQIKGTLLHTFSSDASVSSIKPRIVLITLIKDIEAIIGKSQVDSMNYPAVAYFASPNDLVIDKVINVDVEKMPVVWNYDNITFKSGGSINVTGNYPFKINCNSINK